MTPAERLLKAAEILDKRASEATEGPWRHHDTHLFQGGHTATILSGAGDQTSLLAWLPTFSDEPWDNKQNAWANARYIATMHPEVGKALAALLGHAGRLLAAKEDVYQLAADAGRENFDGFFGYSLMLADLVLAGEQEQARG